MQGGRTTWWPCDAAEHDRENNAELGEVFGADGPLLMRVMKGRETPTIDPRSASATTVTAMW